MIKIVFSLLLALSAIVAQAQDKTIGSWTSKPVTSGGTSYLTDFNGNVVCSILSAPDRQELAVLWEDDRAHLTVNLVRWNKSPTKVEISRGIVLKDGYSGQSPTQGEIEPAGQRFLREFCFPKLQELPDEVQRRLAGMIKEN